MKVDTYVTYRANMETGKKYVKIGAIFFMVAALLFLFEQLLAFRSRKRASSKQVGGSSDLSPPEVKEKRSVVKLVRSATDKIKGVAQSTVASVTKKTKGTSGEEGGEMDGDSEGSYNSPSSEDSIEKFEK